MARQRQGRLLPPAPEGLPLPWRAGGHAKDGCIVKHRWTAALLALALVLALPFSAAAETFSTEDFTMEIPEGTYVFTPTTSTEDPNWAMAGVANPESELSTLAEMNGVAELVTEDGETTILVQQQESDQTQAYFNLRYLTEKQQADFLDAIMQSQTDEITVDKYYLDVDGQPFYRIRIDGTYQETGYHELIYGTIVNGFTLAFNIYGGEESVTQEQEDLLLGIVESVQFSEILPKPETTVDTSDIVTTISLLVLLVLVILIPAVYFPIKSKRDKKLKARLADQLTAYHKEHGDNETILGDMLFANSTDCTKEAIHTFALYQSYIKNVGSLVIGAFLCLATLICSFALDADWWIKLLAVGIVVYYGYKIFNMPHTLEKVQRKVFDRGVSSTAHYAFYDEAFRVSGVQSASMFPYFQITDVRRHSHYLYLYYGPDNAYLVDQFGFSVGEWEDFVKFISQKTGKKL